MSENASLESGPLYDKLREIVTIDPNEAINILTNRIGALERQHLMDSMAIQRLVAHIREISPQDPETEPVTLDPAALDLDPSTQGDPI